MFRTSQDPVGRRTASGRRMLQAALMLGLSVVMLPQIAGTARASAPLDGARKIDAAAPATTPMLRPFVELNDSAIHLGDVFDNAGRYADRAIASAPEPGASVVLEAAWLWRVANAYGLDWRPASRHETSTVRRASTRIPASTLAELMHQAAAREISGDPELIDLEFDTPLSDLNLEPGNEATVRLDRWSFDPASGRFSANLAAPATGTPKRVVTVAGWAHRLTLVPVPTRRIGQGEVIGRGDIDWQPMREQTLARTVIAGETVDVVGMAARRPLSAGTALRATDVEPPILVERRANVMVVLQMPQMTLTMQGKALDRGALGETVRVENLHSKRLVEGVVSGPGKVTIDLPHALALR